MKWLPFMSNFVLERMCMLIKSGVQTGKGFKEVHLTAVAKALLEHYSADVSSTQVYNHLRKWGLKWLTVPRLRDLRGAQWCENSKCILLKAEHYHGHVAVRTLSTSLTSIIPYLQNKHTFFESYDHPIDAEFLNSPIMNYNEMQTIFLFSLPWAQVRPLARL
jgi:hypothetical protein